MAIGASSILRAYGASRPAFVLVLSIGGPSLAFAGSVMGARVQRALGPIAAMFALASLWTAFDFLISFSSSGGSVRTPAAAEVGMPMLIQVASLVGFPGITFLLSIVPSLETVVYTPGAGPKVLTNGIGLEICKDMDHQAMLRNDEVQTKPIMLAVPAWDFGQDGWSHARVAILRSVENGVPMARSARDGLLTLNDGYGRLIVQAKNTGPFTVLTGDLPLGECGGNTVYDVMGDAFGWSCVALSLVAMTLSRIRTRQPLFQKLPMVAR